MTRLTRSRRLCMVLGLALAGLAAALDAPALTGRVVDRAGLLDADQRVALEQKLADFEQKTGVQVAVLTVSSLEGDTIEAFSMRVAEAWKLGQKRRTMACCSRSPRRTARCASRSAMVWNRS